MAYFQQYVGEGSKYFVIHDVIFQCWRGGDIDNVIIEENFEKINENLIVYFFQALL